MYLKLLLAIQKADGTPIPGFTQRDCEIMMGDKIDGTVQWKGKSALFSLAGQPVRLHFSLREADLYSLKFQP